MMILIVVLIVTFLVSFFLIAVTDSMMTVWEDKERYSSCIIFSYTSIIIHEL